MNRRRFFTNAASGLVGASSSYSQTSSAMGPIEVLNGVSGGRVKEAVFFPFDHRSVPFSHGLRLLLMAGKKPGKSNPIVLRRGKPGEPDDASVRFYGTVISETSCISGIWPGASLTRAASSASATRRARTHRSSPSPTASRCAPGRTCRPGWPRWASPSRRAATAGSGARTRTPAGVIRSRSSAALTIITSPWPSVPMASTGQNRRRTR